jgi:hypothetical protein
MYTPERLLFQSPRVRFPGCYVVGHFNQRINLTFVLILSLQTYRAANVFCPKVLIMLIKCREFYAR